MLVWLWLSSKCYTALEGKGSCMAKVPVINTFNSTSLMGTETTLVVLGPVLGFPVLERYAANHREPSGGPP